MVGWLDQASGVRIRWHAQLCRFFLVGVGFVLVHSGEIVSTGRATSLELSAWALIAGASMLADRLKAELRDE